MPRRRREAFLFGLAAETRAAWWLRLKGFRILAERYRGGGGEIDLIARRGRLLIFVEVKARPDLDSAALAVTPHKLERIAHAARGWLSSQSDWSACDIRFDAVLVAPGRLPRHLANIGEIAAR